MAQKNRADLQAVIDANLPDNTTDFITPLLHREVEEDLKDSNFNKLDDTAFDVNYTPTTPLDWGATVPTETGEGLDELASRLGKKQSFYINSDDTVSGGESFQGPIVINASSEIISGNLTGAFYEYSNDGVSYTTVGGTDTLADLITFITGNVGVFWIRAYGVYSGTGNGTIQFSYY